MGYPQRTCAAATLVHTRWGVPAPHSAVRALRSTLSAGCICVWSNCALTPFGCHYPVSTHLRPRVSYAGMVHCWVLACGHHILSCCRIIGLLYIRSCVMLLRLRLHGLHRCCCLEDSCAHPAHHWTAGMLSAHVQAWEGAQLLACRAQPWPAFCLMENRRSPFGVASSVVQSANPRCQQLQELWGIKQSKHADCTASGKGPHLSLGSCACWQTCKGIRFVARVAVDA
jgi:hypothetical protein